MNIEDVSSEFIERESHIYPPMSQFDHKYLTVLRALQQARRERDDARLEAMHKYLKSPAMKTFAELKHSAAGTVLAMLGDGAISRGKCCEALAQLAHGVSFDLIPLPEEKGRQFSEDEIPAEVVEQLETEIADLRKRLEAAEKDSKRLDWLEDERKRKGIWLTSANGLFGSVESDAVVSRESVREPDEPDYEEWVGSRLREAIDAMMSSVNDQAT